MCVCCGEYALQNVVAREAVANVFVPSCEHKAFRRTVCYVQQDKQYHVGVTTADDLTPACRCAILACRYRYCIGYDSRKRK